MEKRVHAREVLDYVMPCGGPFRTNGGCQFDTSSWLQTGGRRITTAAKILETL